MADLRIEQAVFASAELVARSPGFRDEAAAVEMIRLYGTLPAGAEALFARPLGNGVAVVRVRGHRFHVLAVPARLYRALHDPFRIAGRWAADFTAHGELPTLTWTDGPLPPRSLDDVRNVLQAGDGPTLLGAAQALVDGGRVALERDGPDSHVLEDLWMLLPTSNRAELTLATFAPDNKLGFDVLVTPTARGEAFEGYITESQAGDYPEGRYELALQMAVENGDEAAVRQLLARRSGAESLRLAFTLLGTAVAMGLAVRFIPWEKLRLNGDELVLVVPAAALERLGPFAGLTTDVERYLPHLLDPAGLSFRPRSEVETDPSWLQLIPYVVLEHAGRLFHYTRGSAGGEQRLHAKRSIGLGGHINPTDIAGGDPYRAGMRRELGEEVEIGSPYAARVLGLVHDPATAVGRVHLGVVHVLTLDRPAVQAREAVLLDGGFAMVAELAAERAAFESWSQFVLDEIRRSDPAGFRPQGGRGY